MFVCIVALILQWWYCHYAVHDSNITSRTNCTATLTIEARLGLVTRNFAVACSTHVAANALCCKQVFFQLGVQALRLTQLCFKVCYLCLASFSLPCSVQSN